MPIEINRSIYDEANPEEFVLKLEQGINEDIVRQISKDKNEPEWMLNKRIECLNLFYKIEMPKFGPDLKNLDLNKITYYGKPKAKPNASSWDEVPENIKRTFEKLGIPEAERKYFAGAGGQYDSQVIYHNLKEEYSKKGIVFLDFDEAVKEYPELVKKYFMTRCVSPSLHKFAALHGAVFSGGTFIYVPKGIKVDKPMQAYFRMNAEKMGQFEHTLIIVEEDSEVTYIEACSAPKYTQNSLHAGCVEIIVKKGARARYYSVENWSKNTYNLNTKRALVEENGVMEWINSNFGSNITMLYPCSVLAGKNSKADYLGIAFATKGQHQDTGTKLYHIGENTSSTSISKSFSMDGGITTYRGLIDVSKLAKNSKVNVECDAMMTDNISQSNTIPLMKIRNNDVKIQHEASISRISEDQLFYLTSRGINEEQAKQMIVSGFLEPISKKLPIEYAVEMNRLVELEMEGTLG